MAEIVDIHEQKLNIHETFRKTPVLMPNDQYFGLAWMEGEYRLHRHNMDELFLVIEGHLSIEIEGDLKELSPGMSVLIKKGERHMSKASRRTLAAVFEPRTITTEFL